MSTAPASSRASGPVMTPRQMIDRLVGFPTVSRDSNMDLIEFVRDYLQAHGVLSHLVPNEDGTKANLYATVGPQCEGGVVLSGHTDVVPVDGQPWDTDPFVVTRKGARLYGRGTADMKSFYAIALALVPEMLRSGLRRPLHFALSYDEEIGCVGAPAMIERVVREWPAPRAVIVGEPTSMQVVSAHKGMAGFETVVTGHEAHSSQTHRGVSAVMTAARLIAFLDDMARANAAKASAESPFEPPYTTIHVGVVHGGTAMNIISRECRFSWDVRNIPEEDAMSFFQTFQRHCETEVLPAMRAVAPEADIVTQCHFNAPGLQAEPGSEAEQLARVLTGDNATHVVPYGAEAGQFQQAGLSTIICGPGSIDQAHQPNEYIDIDQIEACEAFMHRLVSLQAS
ncbi:MAG: acetylornithine deacetylase [Gammaproteobacteria bacterium]